jgi:hypothetical protein
MTTTGVPLTGGRAMADQVFLWGLLAFLLAGVVQFFLAGIGVFGLDGSSLEDATSLDPHRALGFAMGGLSLVLLAAALVARVSTRTMVLSFVLALLAAFGQSLLAGAGKGSAFFGGLHALDGLVILGLAGFLHGQARRRQRAEAVPSSGT